MWLVYWDAWVTPKLRANAADLPDELVAYVEAARRLAAVHVASMTSAVGSAVDEEAEAGASSADGDETSERERSGSTTAEVAGARLGLSGRQVRNLLRQGRLAGDKSAEPGWSTMPRSRTTALAALRLAEQGAEAHDERSAVA